MAPNILRKWIMHRRFIPVTILAAVILRLLWIVFVRSGLSGMAAWFIGTGMSIAQGQGYVWQGIATAYYPVGYSTFLGGLFGLFGANHMVALWANGLLSLGILLLTYFIAKRVFQSELTARISLFVLALYPNQIAYCSIIHSETFFLFLFLLATFFFVLSESPGPTMRNVGYSMAGGLLFGMATLTKPMALFLPLALAMPLWVGAVLRKEHRSLFHSAHRIVLLYCVLLATVIPWVIRNYRVFGSFIPVSTNMGINFFIGNVKDPAHPNDFEKAPLRKEFAAVMALQDEYLKDAKLLSLAMKHVGHHPLETLRLIPHKLRSFYARDTEGIRYNAAAILELTGNRRGVYRGIEAAAQVFYLITAALFLFSPFLYFWPNRGFWRLPFAWSGLGVIAYFTLVYGIIFFGDPRFHFPFIPWMVMYAAAALENLFWKGSTIGSQRLVEKNLIK